MKIENWYNFYYYRMKMQSDCKPNNLAKSHVDDWKSIGLSEKDSVFDSCSDSPKSDEIDSEAK